jgi:hypothetical protein
MFSVDGGPGGSRTRVQDNRAVDRYADCPSVLMGPIAKLEPGALFRLSECQRALDLTSQREDYRPHRWYEPVLHPEKPGYLSSGRPGRWWPWDLTHAAMATRLKLLLLLAVFFCAPCSRDHASAPSLVWLPCRNPYEPFSDSLLPCPCGNDKWHGAVFFAQLLWGCSAISATKRSSPSARKFHANS